MSIKQNMKNNVSVNIDILDSSDDEKQNQIVDQLNESSQKQLEPNYRIKNNDS